MFPGTNPAIFRANGYGYGPGWIQAYYDGLPGPIINVWSGTYEVHLLQDNQEFALNSIYNYTAQYQEHIHLYPGHIQAIG